MHDTIHSNHFIKPMVTVSKKIQKIFDDNKVNDLQRFIEKRQKINRCNVKLRYIYYLFHYSSILITTIAIGYNNNNIDNKNIKDMIKLVWIGISLNVLSTMINAIENMNKTISKRMMLDITKIKSGNYIDEAEMLDSFHDSSSKTEHNSNDNNINNVHNKQTVIPI